jgi:hypothetical protein
MQPGEVCHAHLRMLSLATVGVAHIPSDLPVHLSSAVHRAYVLQLVTSALCEPVHMCSLCTCVLPVFQELDTTRRQQAARQAARLRREAGL